MTNDEIVRTIRLAIPADRPEADQTAKAILQRCIAKIGRSKSTHFNRAVITFNLEAGKSVYSVRDDIAENYSDIWSVGELWRTDIQGAKVTVMPMELFNSFKRGSDITGPPDYGMFHSAQATFEVYPIPDGTYTLWCYARKPINKVDDIPAQYHDVICDLGIAFARATYDRSGRMAAELAAAGLRDIVSDSQSGWSGTYVQADVPIFAGHALKTADSRNLRPR